MTTDPTNTPAQEPTMTLNALRTLTRMAADIREKQLQIGRSLPPVRYADLISDGCNFLDRAFSRDVDDFMRKQLTPIDVTLLDREDVDKWALLTWRYEVVETPEGADESWNIFDRYEGSFVTGEDDAPLAFDCQEDAEEECRTRNFEWQDEFHGFPFAWNTGWIVDNGRYWLDDLRAAGFLVYEYDGDAIVAGIDGGGYSFKGAHFAPLYATLAAKNDWLVETDDGPRRITVK